MPISAAPQQGSTFHNLPAAASAKTLIPDHSSPQQGTFVGLSDPLLALAADVLDDLERVKIANQNRLRSLTRIGEDKDGEERGFGLDESHPDVARLAALVEMLEKAEHDATLNLQRVMRRHPLGPWIKTKKGIGDKQAARLLAKIGDPYWNHADDKARTVSALWAYCGLHVLPASQELHDAHLSTAGGSSLGGDSSRGAPVILNQSAGVAARRKKGVQSNWSQDAKMRAWLIIGSCMKQLDPYCKGETGIADHLSTCNCSEYRIKVDKRRIHTAVTHPDWTPGHSLQDGMRIASKELLKDLWIEARRLHNE